MDYKNSLGKKYAQSAKEIFSWNNMELPAISSMLRNSITETCTVLDLGCGDGRIIPHLKQFGLAEENYFGVDIDNDLIELAKKDYPKANLLVQDIGKLDGEKISYYETQVYFDLILSIHVLHYFSRSQLAKIFQSCAKTQKTGGKLVFLVAHPIRWVADDLSQYYKGGIRTISTTWGTQMEIHLNSLEAYLSTALEFGYAITKYVEPVPNPESEAINPDEYKKYFSQPSRLLVELTKI